MQLAQGYPLNFHGSSENWNLGIPVLVSQANHNTKLAHSPRPPSDFSPFYTAAYKVREGDCFSVSFGDSAGPLLCLVDERNLQNHPQLLKAPESSPPRHIIGQPSQMGGEGV